MKEDRDGTEHTAASQLGRFLHREFGLTPAAVHADLHRNVLTVRLVHALTPMARIVAHEDTGGKIVQGVYDALLADCREKLGDMAAEITGFPVRHIQITLDAPTEDVTVEFLLQSKGDMND